MVTFRTVQCHPGLMYILISDIRTLYGAHGCAPACPNVRNLCIR